MLIWFAGLSVLLVWSVFRDPAIDYRLVAAGALLPDVVDLALGGARVAHSVTASIVLLTAVMLATVRRRSARRRLLAVPIGTFVHLVLDGAWTLTRTFWWPFFGVRFDDVALPSLARPLPVLLLMEAAGVAALVVAWRRFGLADPERRVRLLRTGRLDPSLRERPIRPTEG